MQQKGILSIFIPRLDLSETPTAKQSGKNPNFWIFLAGAVGQYWCCQFFFLSLLSFENNG